MGPKAKVRPIRLILGFQSREETATLVYRTLAKCRWSFAYIRIKFPRVSLRYFSVHQHGRRDVRWKPSFVHADFWGGDGGSRCHLRFQVVASATIHIPHSRIQIIKRIVLLNKIQGLNYGAPLLGLPESMSYCSSRIENVISRKRWRPNGEIRG